MQQDIYDKYIYAKAVAFHYRRAEREHSLPWQPDKYASEVHMPLPVVTLENARGDRAAYAFAEAPNRKARFRAIEPQTSATTRRAVQAAHRLVRVREGQLVGRAGKPARAKDVRMLLEYGLSHHEVGQLLGVTRQRVAQIARMVVWRITSSTGVDLGTHEASSEREAIERLSRVVDLRKHGLVDESGKLVFFLKVDRVA